jgi:hypothetical protein
MDPRGHEVEREDRKYGEQSFDEHFPALPLGGGCRPVDAVQELGSADRGNAGGLLAMCAQGIDEVERPLFGGDKDRRIDQRPQGDRGGRP